MLSILHAAGAAVAADAPPAPATAPTVVETPAPAPVVETPAPAPVVETPAPAPAPAEGASAKSAGQLPGGVSITGEVRPRLVAEQGRDFVGKKKADQVYVTQRARLGVALSSTQGVEVAVRLQDVRAWGEEGTPSVNDLHAEGLDAHEAWARVKLGDAFALKLGRQEIILDNQRLVGAANWRQPGQSFDAGRLTWTGEAADADLFFSTLAESSERNVKDATFATRATRDVSLTGLHGHFKLGEGLELSATYLLRKAPAAKELRHTAGVYSTLAAQGFKGSLEAYYQAGDLAKKSISAYLAAVRAGYDFGGALAPFVQGFGEVVSGKNGHPEKAFDTLYATNHGFYGEFDQFINLPKHTAGLGLMDVGARVSLKPAAGLTTGLDYHLFRAMDAGADKKKDFGQELDAKADWKAVEHVSVGLLYTVFLPGKLTQDLAGIAKTGDRAAENAAYLTTDVVF